MLLIGDQFEIVNYFLNYPHVFKFAKTNRDDYSFYLIPFIEDKLAILRQQSLSVNQHTPGIFDLKDPQEVKLYCDILHNLISRNNTSLQNDIRFLLQIPALKVYPEVISFLNSDPKIQKLIQGFEELSNQSPPLALNAVENSLPNQTTTSYGMLKPRRNRSFVGSNLGHIFKEGKITLFQPNNFSNPLPNIKEEPVEKRMNIG